MDVFCTNLCNIRFLNTVMDSKFDVSLNDTNKEFFVSNLTNGKLSDYVSIPSNNYKIKILYLNNEVYNTDINLNVYKSYTLIISNVMVNAISQLKIILLEDLVYNSSGQSLVRIINCLPDIPNIDIYVAQTDQYSLMANNIPFLCSSPYLSGLPGMYNAIIVQTECNKIISKCQDLVLDNCGIHTIFVINKKCIGRSFIVSKDNEHIIIKKMN